MKKAHFIGIKGVGMTALALIFKEQGWQVTGSDVDQSFITDSALKQARIPVFAGFSPDHLHLNLDLVIYSGAYKPTTNPELHQAFQLNLKVVTQQQALAHILQSRHLVAVAGVGGKTTTTAILTHIFRNSNRNPGYFIGAGQFNGLFKPGGWGQAEEIFIAEADEYANNPGLDNTPKLLLLQPKEIILPNLQYDHPDIYHSPQDTLTTFRQFIQKLPPQGRLYFNADNLFIEQLINSLEQKPQLISVGFSRKANWFIETLTYQEKYTHLLIFHEGKKFTLKLLLFGKHNARNAVLAAALALEHGLTWSQITQALSNFTGVGRRQEFKGQLDSVLFYDDYAHHPAEIKATIQAFKERFPKRRLWVFFESHTYTRTQTLLDDFVAALSLADKISIMPIFASARENSANFSIDHHLLVKKLQALGKDAQALTFQTASDYLHRHLQPQDLILTMGAGFVYKLHQSFLKSNS